MATETLNPDGITGVHRDLWTIGGGSTKWGNMIDALDSTYVSETVLNERQDFTLANPVITTGQVLSVDQMDISYRAAELVTDIGLKVGFGDSAGVYCDSAEQALTTTITNYSRTALGNPVAACGAWTYADVLTAETSMHPSALGGGASVRVYELSVTMTYTLVPTGGFCYLIATCLPPMLAVASHGLSLRDIVNILRKEKTQPSKLEELMLLQAAFRVRPRFAF